jgi:hypothetical protein
MSETIDRETFLSAYRNFTSDVKTYGRSPFRSLREGVVERNEGYKTEVRELALVQLAPASWSPNTVGQGKILKHVISAIEIHQSADVRNNMCDWGQNRHGASEPAFLKEELSEPGKLRKFENLVFDLFLDRREHSEVMDALVDLLGRRYPLFGYLFFLRDDARYLPIRPQTFDAAFEKLGLSLRTSGKCSWENYEAFCFAIEQTRQALVEWAGLDNVRLIDAHSFVWMMVRIPNFLEEQRRKGVHHRDALHDAALKMAYNIKVRTEQSKGQTVQRVIKPKDFGFASVSALYEDILKLWDAQNSLCRLTGLPMLAEAPIDGTNHLVMSVDRIDSDRGYEPDNIQLVCLFANLWKSDASDDVFAALIDIIRRGSDAYRDYPKFAGSDLGQEKGVLSE